MIGCEAKATALVDRLDAGLAAARESSEPAAQATRLLRRVGRTSDLRYSLGLEVIAIAGGDDCFPQLAQESLGKNRIIADPLEVPRRAPDIILGSWCGKKFQPDSVKGRPGWSEVPAIRNDFVREIKSSLILQPGPAALTDGLQAVQQVIFEWAASAAGRGA